MAGRDLQIGYEFLNKVYANPKQAGGVAGAIRTDKKTGLTLILLQAHEALSFGDLCTPLNGTGLILNADVDAAAAIDAIEFTATGDFTTTALAGSAAVGVDGGHILRGFFDVNGTGVGQGFVVRKRVDDNTLRIYVETNLLIPSPDGKIVVATHATDTDYVIFTKTRVEQTDAATDIPIAICPVSDGVAANEWFWGVYEGDFHVLFKGASTTLRSNLVLIPGSTAGYAFGTAATATTLEMNVAFGKSNAGVDCVTDCLLPCNVNFRKLWSPGTIGTPSDYSVAYPNGTWQTA